MSSLTSEAEDRYTGFTLHNAAQAFFSGVMCLRAGPFSTGSMQSTEMFFELWSGWLTLILIVLALLYGFVVLFSGRAPGIPLKWIKILFPSIGLIGILIAVYIAYVQLFQVQAVCGPLEECNTVLQSPYGRLLGFIPNSVLGVISYLTLFFLWAWHLRAKDWLARYAPLFLLGIALLGSLLAIYLTVLQVFVLKALCIWCLSSAVAITLLFLLSVSLYQLDQEAHHP